MNTEDYKEGYADGVFEFAGGIRAWLESAAEMGANGKQIADHLLNELEAAKVEAFVQRLLEAERPDAIAKQVAADAPFNPSPDERTATDD